MRSAGGQKKCGKMRKMRENAKKMRGKNAENAGKCGKKCGKMQKMREKNVEKNAENARKCRKMQKNADLGIVTDSSQTTFLVIRRHSSPFVAIRRYSSPFVRKKAWFLGGVGGRTTKSVFLCSLDNAKSNHIVFVLRKNIFHGEKLPNFESNFTTPKTRKPRKFTKS